MFYHLSSRLGQSLMVLLAMSVFSYGLVSLMPGDPFSLMAAGSPGMTADDVARLRALWGGDQPWTLRYLHWLGQALSGDFGFSRLAAMPVTQALARPLGNSLSLMACGLSAGLLAAIPAGIVAATREESPLDHLLGLTAFVAVSLPAFWLGLLAIIVFAVGLAWLPASGVATVGDGGLADRLRHLVLPTLALGAVGFGHYMRYMRAQMLLVLREDWIRTARAKGLSWLRVILHHALRNALAPLVTVVALDMGTLFSGLVVTETVFAFPGMGKLIFDAVQASDFDLAQAALMLATGITLAGSILADVAYRILDPRIGR